MPLKLSEAIRLGAMLRPQAFGNVFDGVGSCAIGAAYEACGITLRDQHEIPDEDMAARADTWNALGPHECPGCGARQRWTCAVVAHLNDDHRWTREQIADWVETIEAQHEASIAKDSAAGCDDSRPVVCGVETNN